MATGAKPYTNSVGVNRFSNPSAELSLTAASLEVDLIEGRACTVAIGVSKATDSAAVGNPLSTIGEYSSMDADATGTQSLQAVLIVTAEGKFRNIGVVVKGGGIFAAQILPTAVAASA